MKFLKNEDLAKLVLRVGLGAMILFHGVSKIANPDMLGFIHTLVQHHGLPDWVTYGVFLGEILAPVMLVFGIYAQIGGLLVFGNMLFVFWLAHLGQLFTLSPHGGWGLELQGLYLVGGLAVMLLGGGKYSLKPD